MNTIVVIKVLERMHNKLILEVCFFRDGLTNVSAETTALYSSEALLETELKVSLDTLIVLIYIVIDKICNFWGDLTAFSTGSG